MRLSKLQKWILTNTIKEPYEEGKELTSWIEGFSPREYYWLSRRFIMDKYFGASYIREIKGGFWSNGKPLRWNYKPNKLKAEVTLSRSLKTIKNMV